MAQTAKSLFLRLLSDIFIMEPIDCLAVILLRNNAGLSDTESLSRTPLQRLWSTLDIGVELINLLQTESLGLVDHEVDEGNADEAEATPNEEDLGLKVGVAWTIVHKVWSGVSDGPVEQPVGGGGH